MKKLRKILCVLLILGFALNFPNANVKAEEIQYSENLIPKMTSDTSPSGKASSSSVYVNANGSKQSAYLAFDRSTAQLSAWGASSGSKSGWLEYEFTDKKCITKYTLQPREWVGYEAQSPKDWTFEAWNDETSTWDILDTQTNITDWTVGVKKEFAFTNPKSYLKYRINVSAIVDDLTVTNPKFHTLTIGELEMMETITPATDKILKVVLGVGESLQLSVNNDLDVNKKLTWTSDDNSIATVDANGITTGVKSGSTVITVTNADGSYKETINLLVINDETDLQLAIDLRVGDTRRLTVDDLTDTVNVTWASNSNAVATVSDTGKVTAVSAGTTYVTATDEQGNEIGKILVRVRK